MDVVESLFKLLLAGVTLATCIYSMSVFGPGLWSVAIAVTGVVVLLSAFVRSLRSTGTVLARLLGVLAVVGLGLLLLASTVGGSARMSDSNQIIAVGLFVMSAIGFAFFFIRLEKQH